MKILKNKIAAIAIAMFLMLSMSASMMLIPNASAHTPAWNIPTYAYISAEPDTIGVGQTITVYIWLDPVYGAAGGTSAIVGTTGFTASAALTSNGYRFLNYKLTITAPDGTVSTRNWAYVADTTSNQYTTFTPTQVGTYNLSFTYPGQVYGAGGNGYSGSSLINDTYLPSSASTTVTVQQTPIPAAVTSEPMPTAYWTRPIYGENSNWYTISSDWLGTGSPPIAGYTTFTGYHGDAVGPLTAHVMWTLPIQQGGVVGGNLYTNAPGVSYFEGTAYLSRLTNPIIVDGYLYYKGVVGFTGSAAGPLNCVNLQTGQLVWSSNAIPAISFAYIYNLWNGEQHGAFQPILFTSNFGQAFDAYTGTPMFNVTGVPSGTAVPGPSSEQLRICFQNAGTAANPQWYLAEWNSSKLWQYDVSPYSFGGSTSPSLINATNGALVSSSGIPITMAGTTATLPPAAPGIPGVTISVPYGSSVTVNANIPINSSTIYPLNTMAQTTYDWNVSLPWLNTMPIPPTYSSATGLVSPGIAGSNPVSVVGANTGDVMLCRNGSLPTGFSATSTGYPQLPYTFFAVNLNASQGAIGSILWMKNYDPPAGNLTISTQGVDWQTRTFVEYYKDTMQYVGFSLSTGAQLWGPTASMVALQYYGQGSMSSYQSAYGIAYGNLYATGMGGLLYCYNDLTGALKWTYGNGGSGNSTESLSSPYGEYPSAICAIGNGVVYLSTTEHTFTDPIYKGALYRAVNATTGQEVWTLSGAGSSVRYYRRWL